MTASQDIAQAADSPGTAPVDDADVGELPGARHDSRLPCCNPASPRLRHPVPRGCSLSATLPKLSDERKSQLEQQEWAKMPAKRIAELEGNFRVAGLFIQLLRDGLAGMGRH